MNCAKKRFIFFFIIFLVFFAQGAAGSVAVPPSTFEIDYPEIPGLLAPQKITDQTTLLPGYVKYIFQLSVVIIGFAIFAVMVYSGVKYLASTGDPAKMADAREGIFSAFLGGIILLSAYILFNTINPQLTIMKLPKVPPLTARVIAGVYICDYEVENIGVILNGYLNPSGATPEEKVDSQIEAVKQLKEIMRSEKGSCPRRTGSGNLERTTKGTDTIFILPSKKYNPDNPFDWQYEHGLALHQNDNLGGKCKYFPEERANLIYRLNGSGNYPFPVSLGFEAKSVTLFRKPTPEPPAEAEGIILYGCQGYDEHPEMCPEGTTTIPRKSFPPGADADIRKVAKDDLGEPPEGLANNTLSIKIEPQGSYFALLYSGENFDGDKCELIKNNDPNLLNNAIGKCGNCTAVQKIYGWAWWVASGGWARGVDKPACYPCTQSIIVIEGQAQ